MLELKEWEPFLEALCGDREYQKEAIRAGILFLASGNYQNTESLVAENFAGNREIQKKYESLDHYLEQLQVREKLFANIDLATGSGKTYVMYGIARIMMGLGRVNRVLVLCPSLTIEKGLTQKFMELSANPNLRNTIPSSAQFSHPRIVDANSTIKAGDICIENIHAVYRRTGSSIS